MALEIRTFGTQADDAAVGATAWSSPGNAAASDDSRSTAAAAGAGLQSHYHKSTNSSHASGDTLESGDTVTEIKYRFEKRKSNSGNVRDWKIYPVEGGSVVTTTNFANTGTDWLTSDDATEYTQTTNLPSADTILASDWGVVIACQNTNGFPATGELDYVEAYVIFTPAGTVVIPSTVALVLATFAPTVLTPRTAIPSTVGLTLTAFAPAINVGKTVVPSTLELVTAAFAPTVLTPRTITPTTRALVTTGFAPTIQDAGKIVTPATLAFVTAAFAPTVLLPRVARPSTLALTLTTFAPAFPVAREWSYQRLTLHDDG